MNGWFQGANVTIGYWYAHAFEKKIASHNHEYVHHTTVV